jgi:hypothetical protein
MYYDWNNKYPTTIDHDKDFLGKRLKNPIG